MPTVVNYMHLHSLSFVYLFLPIPVLRLFVYVIASYNGDYMSTSPVLKTALYLTINMFRSLQLKLPDSKWPAVASWCDKRGPKPCCSDMYNGECLSSSEETCQCERYVISLHTPCLMNTKILFHALFFTNF